MTDAAQWQAQVGDTWAQEWRRTDRSFAGVSQRLDAAVRTVAPETGAALDIGCGAGATGIALARARPRLAVTGVDLSPGLVAVARQRAAGLANLAVRVGDAADGAVLGAAIYDLAVSRHGVMFFVEPSAAFTAIRRALRPGAPLVFSCFRSVARNPWVSAVVEAITGAPIPPAGDMPGPFAFADARHVSALLAATGWRDARVEPLDYRYIAGEGKDAVDDALDFLSHIGPAARALASVPDTARPAARDRLHALLERHEADGVIAFPAAAWIWTAYAGDPA